MSDGKPEHVHLEIMPMRIEQKATMDGEGQNLTDEEIEHYRQIVIKAIGGSDAVDRDRE